MAKNILDVLANNDVKRSVLIVGAGHAKAVSEELKRLSPNLKVIMYNDLKNHIK
jgi:pheromone shutdown protein TraB